MKTAHWNEFKDIDMLCKHKSDLNETISIVIPTLNEEKCVANIIRYIQDKLMGEVNLVDEILVMDGGSTDKTLEKVAECNVAYFDARTGIGGDSWANGKGLALWRAQFLAKGSIICYIDADIENFDERFILGLVGALLSSSKLGFAKAYYTRPMKNGDTHTSSGGGRVTELLVRPLLSRFYPNAAGFIQPLSGEYAFRTSFLELLRFSTSYAVETVLILEYLKRFRTDTILQIDMGERYHQNQPLANLGKMASAILGHFAELAFEDGIIHNKGSENYSYCKNGSVQTEELQQELLPPKIKFLKI